MTPVRHWFERLFSQDRRSAERHAAPRLVAHYWDGAAPAAHGIRDISSSGLYLYTQARWYPGTLVMMTLQRTGGAHAGAQHAIAVQSKVVRWGADGVGCGFVFPEKGASREAQGLSNAADRKTLGRFLDRDGGKRWAVFFSSSADDDVDCEQVVALEDSEKETLSR